MCRKPRLTSNPKSRLKRMSWLRTHCVILQRQLADGFSESWEYGRWRQRGGRRVVRHLTVEAQVLDCNRKLNSARRELAVLEEGGAL